MFKKCDYYPKKIYIIYFNNLNALEKETAIDFQKDKFRLSKRSECV